MPSAITREQCLEALEAYARLGTKQAAAEELGVKPHTLANRLRVAADRGLDPYVVEPLPEGQTLKGASTMYSYDKVTGQPVRRMQWVKTNADHDNREMLIEALQDTFKDYKLPTVPAPKTVADEDLLTVFPIADLHLGMFAWGEETGEDYDMKIAYELLRGTMADLLARTPDAGECILLNLGDFFHGDDSMNQTRGSGHQLDIDTRYAKVLRTGVSLMFDIVTMAAAKFPKVRVVNLPGNHDGDTAEVLKIAMSCSFKDNPRIIVDTEPGDYWFHRHGGVLLGAHHGHKAKMKEFAGIMAARQPINWGATAHRYFYTGHIHHREKLAAYDGGGCEAESFATIAAQDAYNSGQGYNARRQMTAITHHLQLGERVRDIVNIPRQRTYNYE